MLVSFLGLFLFGSILLLPINGMDGFYYYYKLDKWGFTISALKLSWGVIVFVGWGAWFWLGVLIERKLKIQIFRRGLLYYYHRLRVSPNLSKVIARKRISSTDVTNNKGTS